MQHRTALLGLVMAMSALLAGCDAASDPVGRVIVRMTDAPVASIDEINVSIESCEVINSRTDERQMVSSTDSAATFNLLDFADGASLDVCNQEVVLTSFDQLRVVVGEAATITVSDGSSTETTDLKIASGSTAGIKFFFDEAVDLSGGGTLDVLLDFVAEESVVTLGPVDAPTGYVMTPVIRAVSAELNQAQLAVSEEGPVGKW